jgi:hypothetical protein
VLSAVRLVDEVDVQVAWRGAFERFLASASEVLVEERGEVGALGGDDPLRVVQRADGAGEEPVGQVAA